ncbi:MAG: hypothetical protein EOP22_13840 [Hyphomicrobiales bacterium]|nr:MAG: hypothetical protein EOP22_13840 [Hyphomicrobiales bacterium]
MSALPVICSFWHGDLGWLGRICIASFLERGHRFELYAYGDIGAVPMGCVVRDANEVVPHSEMFFYKGNRTPAVFADLFRLKLMQRRAGIWVDCDVYCVRPYAGLGDYIFGRETSDAADTQMVNNAVFACPPGELLGALLKTFEPGAIPPGLPWFRAIEVRLRRLLGEKLPVQDMQFGATGPWPLNYHLKRLGLFERAQAKPVFYPMNYGDALKLMTPGIALAALVQSNTLSAHFWHSSLTDRGSGHLAAPAPGSFFADEIARLGATFSF